MEVIQLFMTTVVIILAIAALALLNKKYDLGLNDMSYFLGSSDNNSRQLNKLLDKKENEIDNLKQRVQVLEKLATDPQEQLKRKIDDLK